MGLVLMVCELADYDPTESRLTRQITLVTRGGFHAAVAIEPVEDPDSARISPA
jgi:hypothetical protein